jgi:hypothetical protein
MTEDGKKLVYLQAYSLAKQYTKGFFAALPTNHRLMSPKVYDAVQGAIFNSYVDAYNQGARDMEVARARELYETK